MDSMSHMVETDAHTLLMSECVGVYCAAEPRKKKKNHSALASVADILGLLDRHKVEFIKNDICPPSAELQFKLDPPSEELHLCDSFGFAPLIKRTQSVEGLSFGELLSGKAFVRLDTPYFFPFPQQEPCIRISLLHTRICDMSPSDLIWLCIESCCDWKLPHSCAFWFV